MKYIVSFSGGIGSFCAAHRLKQSVGSEDITLVFCDTLIEDEDLYRFIDEASNKLELPLVKLADGRNPWQVFHDVKMQGNSRYAPCSKILKRFVMDKYMATLPDKPILVLGIDYTESERLIRAKENNKTYEVIAPLCDEPLISHNDKLKIIKDYGIEIPRLYKMGFPHNNCGGFCVRAGLSQFKLLREKFPERFDWHKEQQNKLVLDNPKLDRPFLRKVVNKELTYISLDKFDKTITEHQEKFDFGGCGCFVDDELK
jgi:3'-phosphoadenosine 5'-phosphosulfate sulfotransferase (PAPS reductase)/FAD synthetase